MIKKAVSTSSLAAFIGDLDPFPRTIPFPSAQDTEHWNSAATERRLAVGLP
jgi:hypothetical protein